MVRVRSPTHLCFWATWQFLQCAGRGTSTVKQGSSSSRGETSSLPRKRLPSLDSTETGEPGVKGRRRKS